MQSIQTTASVMIDSICSYLLYTEDVIRFKQTCKQFGQLDLYEKSGHKQPHGVAVMVNENNYSYVNTYQDGKRHGRQYTILVPSGIQLAEVGAQHILEFADYRRGVAHGLHHAYRLDENLKQYLYSSMYFENGRVVGQSLLFMPNGEIQKVYSSSMSIMQRIVDGVKQFEIQEGGWGASKFIRYTLRADGALLDQIWDLQALKFLSKTEREAKKMIDLLTIEEASGGLFETTCD